MDKKQFRNYFQNENNEFPDNLSWDEMEDGILSKMEALEPSKEILKPPYLRNGLLTALLLVTIGGVFFFTSNRKATENVQSIHNNQITSTTTTPLFENKEIGFQKNSDLQTVNTNLITENTTSQQQSTSGSTQDPIATLAIEKEERIDEKNNKITEATKTNEANLTTNKLSPTSRKIESKLYNQEIKNSTNSLRIELPDQIDFENSVQKNSDNTVYNYEESRVQKTTNENKVTSITEVIPIDNYLKTLELPTKNEVLPISYQVKEIKPAKHISKWSLGIYAGITDWSPNYVDNYFDGEKIKSEKGIIGFGLETNLSYDINEKWTLSTGLEYHHNQSRLDYYLERDTVVMQDVVKQTYNSINGNLIDETVQSDEANAVNWRRIIHYNTYKQFSIPVVLYRNWSLQQKLTASTGVGFKYILSSNEIGKMMDSNDLTETLLVPRQIVAGDYSYQNNFSLVFNLNIHYKLTRQLELGLSTQLNRFANNVNNNTFSTSNPLGISSKLGFKYKF